MHERSTPDGVIVGGMGLACALGIGVDACVSRLQDGIASTRNWTLSELDSPITHPVYFFDGADSRNDLASVVELFKRVVLDAVQSAGLTRGECAALPIFIGSSAFSLDREPIEPGQIHRPSAIGVQPVLAYQQLALIAQQLLGTNGESFSFQTACTSSANAAISAARMIELGWYQHALVIGVEIANLATVAGFSSLQLLANTLRPFDKNREGIVVGEGIGAVVLSASDAGRTGVHICAGGSNIDTFRVTTSNPDGVVIAALQDAVLRRAGVTREHILGIKAHGTGSPMNDAGEASVIKRAYAIAPPVCALKPYIGHTLGACGVNELVLMAGALNAGFFPSTPGFETLDPALGISPTTEQRAAPDGHYLLNYFGFGGHNTIMLVEKRS